MTFPQLMLALPMLIIAIILQQERIKMKKIILLFGLLSFGGAFADIQYIHINDGQHMLQQGDIFTAQESISTANGVPKPIKNIICMAKDTAKINPMMINWTVTVNNYRWHYVIHNKFFTLTQLFKPSISIYKVVIEAEIDDKAYSGPFGYINCFSH